MLVETPSRNLAWGVVRLRETLPKMELEVRDFSPFRRALALKLKTQKFQRSSTAVVLTLRSRLSWRMTQMGVRAA